MNSGKSEIIQVDNNFNVIRVINNRQLFSNNITDVAIWGNYLYVVDSGACQIVMLSEDGTLVKRFGRAGNGNSAPDLKRPNGICIDSRGRVIISDSLNHRVKVHILPFKTDMVVLS